MGSPSDGRAPTRERDRDSSCRSRSRRRRGRGGGEERGKGKREKGSRGGRCVEQREHGEDPLSTQPNRENEQSQTNRGVGGVCVGIVLRIQSKLSRALHSYRGKKLLQDLENL